MDYFELLKKAENINELAKENEELKRKLAEAEQRQLPTIESTVVQAFRNSKEYTDLENHAFNSFLQEKFIKEFQISTQAKQLIEVAQTQFAIFEQNYNKNIDKSTTKSTKTKKEENENEK